MGIWDEKPRIKHLTIFGNKIYDHYDIEEMDAFHEKVKVHYEAKICKTCKHRSYTKFQERYCGWDGLETLAEHTCSHWEAED